MRFNSIIFSFTKKTRAENFGVFVVKMDKISGAVSPGWRYAFFVCGFPGVMVATNSFRRVEISEKMT